MMVRTALALALFGSGGRHDGSWLWNDPFAFFVLRDVAPDTVTLQR